MLNNNSAFIIKQGTHTHIRVRKRRFPQRRTVIHSSRENALRCPIMASWEISHSACVLVYSSVDNIRKKYDFCLQKLVLFHLMNYLFMKEVDGS